MAKFDIKGIWPSMLKFLKGFPKNMKPMIKDPVTNMKELEERRKDVWGYMYTAISLTIIFVILSLIPVVGDFASMLMIIPVLGLMLGGFLLFVLNSAEKRFKALTCDGCGHMQNDYTVEEFAKLVSYTVEKHEAHFDGYSGNKEPTNGVYSLVKFSGSSSALLSVDLTCPKCGAVKHLKYSATPFQCEAEVRNVGALNFKAIYPSLENAVRSAVEDYNDPEKHARIPYTFHSSKNPNFENRDTFKGANASDAHPDYMGVKIRYRKDPEEMLEHYFVLKTLSGNLYDPSKSKKK